MTDEFKLRQQMSRGERSKELLENELLKEAFDRVETTVMDGWKNSAAHEEEQRRNAYLMHRLLQNLREHFQQIVLTGEHANRQLLQIQKESMLKRVVHGRR